jgi:hypothetical protein
MRRIKMYKDEIVLKGILNYIKKIPVLLTKDHFNKKCLELLQTSPFIKKYSNKRTERLAKRFPELWEEYKIWVFQDNGLDSE